MRSPTKVRDSLSRYRIASRPGQGRIDRAVALPADAEKAERGLPTVPKPPTLVMMIAGFAGLGLAGYRGLRKASALAA
jgi:hypothetical protein